MDVCSKITAIAPVKFSCGKVGIAAVLKGACICH